MEIAKNKADVNKEEVYKKKPIVETYNKRLYFGLSGGLSFQEEMINVLDWFTEGTVILDCPCGTGKLGLALSQYKDIRLKDIKLYGSDISELMLKKAHKIGIYNQLSIQNLLKTSYLDNCFDIVYVSRFFMLFKDISPFLTEIKRIVKPNGLLIFDSIRWSIHNLIHVIIGTEEGYNYPRTAKTISKLLTKHGFEILERKSRFILPLGILNRLPKQLFKCLIYLEKYFPESIRTTEFYKVKKQ